ncbi:MAG: hypothetical protein ABSH51_09145 [Solirubrobacteraceae bacterium]|jgi:hypothetical protein
MSSRARYRVRIVSGKSLVPVLLVLLFPGAALVIATQGHGLERRPHFALRIVVVALAMPAVLSIVIGIAVLGVLPGVVLGLLAMLVMLSCIPALILVPSVLFRSPDPPTDDTDDDGRSGPDDPPIVPPGPGGDVVLLPDAGPGRGRVRDHDRPERHPRRPRRPAREPTRAPTHPAQR